MASSSSATAASSSSTASMASGLTIPPLTGTTTESPLSGHGLGLNDPNTNTTTNTNTSSHEFVFFEEVVVVSKSELVHLEVLAREVARSFKDY